MLFSTNPKAPTITSVGYASSGGAADSNKPLITGTADPGDIVTPYDGVRVIGTAIAAADGSWSITPVNALTAGSHKFTALGADPAGNPSPSSMPFPATIPAAVSPPNPRTVSDVTDNGVLIGSTVATQGVNGWTSPTLANGAHTLTVTDTNAAGATSAPLTVSFTVDTTPHAPVITQVMDGFGEYKGALWSGAVSNDPMPQVRHHADHQRHGHGRRLHRSV
jgi:hypothetical protein